MKENPPINMSTPVSSPDLFSLRQFLLFYLLWTLRGWQTLFILKILSSQTLEIHQHKDWNLYFSPNNYTWNVVWFCNQQMRGPSRLTWLLQQTSTFAIKTQITWQQHKLVSKEAAVILREDLLSGISWNDLRRLVRLDMALFGDWYCVTPKLLNLTVVT